MSNYNEEKLEAMLVGKSQEYKDEIHSRVYDANEYAYLVGGAITSRQVFAMIMMQYDLELARYED